MPLKMGLYRIGKHRTAGWPATALGGKSGKRKMAEFCGVRVPRRVRSASDAAWSPIRTRLRVSAQASSGEGSSRGKLVTHGGLVEGARTRARGLHGEEPCSAAVGGFRQDGSEWTRRWLAGSCPRNRRGQPCALSERAAGISGCNLQRLGCNPRCVFAASPILFAACLMMVLVTLETTAKNRVALHPGQRHFQGSPPSAGQSTCRSEVRQVWPRPWRRNVCNDRRSGCSRRKSRRDSVGSPRYPFLCTIAMRNDIQHGGGEACGASKHVTLLG